MPTNDVDLYKQAQQEVEIRRAKASKLIGSASPSLQNRLQDWESNPICPSGNYSVPPDVLMSATSRSRMFVPSTTDEKQIAGALAEYYTAVSAAQRKWALLPQNQKQGLSPPDPLTFA